MGVGWLPRRDDQSRGFAFDGQIDANSELSRPGQTYVCLIVGAGAAAILFSLAELASGPITYQWLILASLTLFSGLFSIRIPSLGARISASETFVFASALLFGPAPATLTVAIDGLLVSLGLKKRALHRTFFNMAEPALSVWISSNCFYLLTGAEPLFGRQVAVGQIFLPLLAMTTTYFVLNSGLIAGAVAFETRTSPIQFLRANGPHLSLNYFASVCLVVLVVQNATNLLFVAAGIIVPLLGMSYFLSKTSVARVEDANRHLADLNKVYLSAAQTLAMAIDAKDEITHGHIRRVQAYALGLARALKVTDPELIRAIEAGALLHDTGKLAVPEYILNKPGRLTPPEFERMKLHAKVGSDIIAAIGFPYPVVPIVRHHHEHWDGTGYPDGLSGADIPLGARILAVVDCFDALTSDRPYRTRLSEEQALDILREGRGTMYDAEVVDTFIAVHKDIEPQDIAVPLHHSALAEISRSSMRMPEPSLPRKSENALEATEEMLAVFSLARSMSGESTLADAAFLIGTHVRRIVPCSTCAFFIADPATDELVARHVAGVGAAILQGMRIPKGHRLSGWVAANRQMMINSDAALDLGGMAEAVKLPLRSCLSTPLLAGEVLVGVLTMYSIDRNGFTDDRAQVTQMLAPHIAQIMRDALESETLAASNSRTRDSSDVTAMPSSSGSKSVVRFLH